MDESSNLRTAVALKAKSVHLIPATLVISDTAAYPKHIDYMREEWNYTMASINIYDEFMDDPDSLSPTLDDNSSDKGVVEEEGKENVIDVALTPAII